MPSFSSLPRSTGSHMRPLRVGFIPLTDAAPLTVAEHLGIFKRHGLDVELCREIGWATIREKIIYGELDAAHAPAPMLWSTTLGLGCRASEVLTAFVLNLHGNAITLSRALWDDGVRDAVALREHCRSRPAQLPFTLGAVFPFSSHHLMLREWLRTAGLDPEREVRIVVVPPGQMFRNLAAGTIDGFCAGEPWNTAAVQAGIGWCPTWSAKHAPGHVEKVLMVTARFADTRSTDHMNLVRALHEAAAWCDLTSNRPQLAHLLAEPRFLNLSPDVIAPALLGQFDCGTGRVEAVPEFHVFHRGETNVPSRRKAEALHRALAAQNLLPPAAAADAELPRRLFREDLHREFLHHEPSHEILTPTSLGGISQLAS